MIQSTQKIIKVGSSSAVTIPAKDLKREGLKPGDDAIITVTAVKSPLDTEYEAFVAQYGETLRNLSQR